MPEKGLDGAEVSRRGACARSATRAAAKPVEGSGLATTTTGEEANKLAVTSSAITSAVPVSTDVAETGARVRGASGTGGAGSCGAAPVQDVVPTATAATSASTAPAACGITARPLPVRQLSTRHPGSTSASHQSSAALPRGEGRPWLWTRRQG